MKVNCYFCNKELEGSKVAGNFYQAFCSVCPEVVGTMYVLEDNGEATFWSASISFEDRDKEYRAFYCPKFFYIDMIPNPFVDVNGKVFYKRVMELSFCPKNITPYNIKQKFQTLKVWS